MIKMPTIVNGKLYPSGSEAARAHGVPRHVVYAGLNRGNVDDAVNGYAPPETSVTVAGETWPSRRALARYLGVSSSTVIRWLHGNKDRLLNAVMKKRMEGSDT